MRSRNIIFAILGALASTCANPSPAFAQALPPIPAIIPTPLGAVRVIRITGLKCGGEEALGCFDAIRRIIALDDSLPPLVAWHTFRHEKCHQTFWDFGVHSLIDDKNKEEAICDAIASSDMSLMLSELYATEQQKPKRKVFTPR